MGARGAYASFTPAIPNPNSGRANAPTWTAYPQTVPTERGATRMASVPGATANLRAVTSGGRHVPTLADLSGPAARRRRAGRRSLDPHAQGRGPGDRGGGRHRPRHQRLPGAFPGPGRRGGGRAGGGADGYPGRTGHLHAQHRQADHHLAGAGGSPCGPRRGEGRQRRHLHLVCQPHCRDGSGHQSRCGHARAARGSAPAGGRRQETGRGGGKAGKVGVRSTTKDPSW